MDRVNIKASIEVMNRIQDIIKNKSKSKKVMHDKAHRKEKLINVSSLREYTRHLPSMKELATEYTGKDPLKIILYQLQYSSAIKSFNRDYIDDNKSIKMIKVLPGFDDYLKRLHVALKQ